VGVLEIESVDQRFAHARILELLAPGIDEPALRRGHRIVGELAALDAAVLEGRKIIARRPDPRGELLAKEIVAGGEPFERDIAVAVVFEANDVEIVLPARDRQIGAPPIFYALILDEAPDVEPADFVGSAAERNIQGRF